MKVSVRRGLLGSLLIAAIAVPALADNFGSVGSTGTSGLTNGVFLTDNYVFIVIQRNLTAAYAEGVEDSMNMDYSYDTDLEVYTFADSSCYDGLDDTCVFDDDYGDNGVNGWNACNPPGGTSGSHPSMICQTQWSRINTYYSPPAQRIACHEIGHSVGLRHSDDGSSCMKTSASGGTSEWLTGHDVGHLVDTY